MPPRILLTSGVSARARACVGMGLLILMTMGGGSAQAPRTAAPIAAGAVGARNVSLGSLVGWGYSSDGELGGGNTAQANPSPLSVTGPSNVTAAVSGGAYSLVLTAGGAVWSSGINSNGQLGNGTTTSSTSFAADPSPLNTGITQVAAGSDWGMALTSAGTVYAFGDNYDGTLGNPSIPTGVGGKSATPVEVCAVGSTNPCTSYLTGVVSIAAGNNTAYALTAAGNVYAWGWGLNGERGNNVTTGAQGTPVEVCATSGCGSFLSGVSAIAADQQGGAALIGGNVFTWGAGGSGQLGNGCTSSCTNSAIPVEVKVGADPNTGAGLCSAGFLCDVSAIAGSDGGYYAIAAGTGNVGGYVYAWGSNGNGELGNHTQSGTAFNASPVMVQTGCTTSCTPLTNVRSVAGYTAGGGAVTSGGAVEMWGYNTTGDLGSGATSSGGCSCVDYASPAVAVGQGSGGTPMAGIQNLSSTSIGATIFAVTGAGASNLDGWGYNLYGETGTGTTTTAYVPYEDLGPGGTGVMQNVVSVSSGNDATVALTGDGHVWTVGNNTYGELGNGTATASVNWVEVCNVGTSGTCSNNYLSNIVAISNDGQTPMALGANGNVYAWGSNNDCQLAQSTTCDSNNHTNPVEVKGVGGAGFLSNIVSISASYASASYAVSASGAAYGWGYNWDAETGTGAATTTGCSCITYPTTVKVGNATTALTGVVAMRGGNFNGMALTAGGNVVDWGYDYDGETGNNATVTTGCSCEPYGVYVSKVGGGGNLTGATSIAPNAQGGAATAGGNVYVWGLAYYSGTTGYYKTPVEELNCSSCSGTYLSGIIAVEGNGYGNLYGAVGQNGTAYMWGNDGSDQLGNGDTTGTAAYLPQPVANLGNVAALAVGGQNVLAIAPPPAPAVTGVAPLGGPTGGGTVVTITGTNLSGVTSVSFGGTATAVTSTTATTVTVTSPMHSAGTVDVTVTSPSGTSATSSADQFIYATAPVVTSVSPLQGPLAGGVAVTVTGTGFTGASGVTFGGTAGTGLTVNSDTSLTITTPAHAAGTVDVVVTAYGGSSATGSADHYIYTGVPIVTGISPTSGSLAAGTPVTVSGYNFTGATAVSFGGTNGTGLTVSGSTQISITAPAHAAATVDVTVTNPSGTSATSSVDQYTFQATAEVSVTMTVSNSTPGAGASVTFSLTAKNNGFDPATSLSVKDKLPSGLTYVSSTPSAGTTYTSSTGVWNIGTLASGSTATLSLVATNVAVTPLTNSADKATENESDPLASDDVANVTLNGAKEGWGYNSDGEVGTGSATTTGCNCVTTPTALSFSGSIASFDAGPELFGGAEIDSTGAVWYQGSNVNGQTGSGTGDSNAHATPTKVSGLTGLTFSQVAGGGYHLVALTTGGNVYAWGNNPSGEVGNGTTSSNSCTCTAPVETKGVGGSGFLSGITQVAAGSGFSMALSSTGQVYVWGGNATGLKGDGTTTGTMTTPVAVSGLGTITKIAAGAGTAYALTSSGQLYAWGENMNGSVGNGTITSTGCQCIPTPTLVEGPGGSGTMSGITTIGSNGYDGMAVISGNLYEWGFNSYGQLGRGGSGTSDSGVPTEVVGVGGSGFLSGITQAGGGNTFSYAIGSGGVVYTWGDDGFGVEGNGTSTSGTHASPVQVPSLTGVSAVGSGYEQMYVLTGTNGDVGVTQSASTTTPTSGQQVTLTITATDNGGTTATNVAISDPLPAGLSYVSSSASAGTATQSAGTVSWSIPTLTAGTSATLTITVQVTGSQSTMTNTVTKTAEDQNDPVIANDSATVTLTIPVPTVSSLSPASGTTAGGTSVVITGTNLASASSVQFGGTAGTITADTATSITVTSPAGSGSVYVTVTTAGGVSATGPSSQYTFLITSTTTLNASPTSSTYGQSVTLTATVTPASPVPTGTVEFLSSGVDAPGCNAVAMSAGAATCTTTSLGAGSDSLTAVYSGDATYLGSTSAAVAATVACGTNVWCIQTTPDPTATTNNAFDAVGCASSTLCFAVGYTVNAGTGNKQTLIQQWNGTSWATVASPNASSMNNELFGISCPASNFCAAAGTYTTATGYPQTLIEQWNGTSWSLATSPDTSTTVSNNLNDVSCFSSSFCMADGWYQGANAQTLIEEWNGTSWAIITSANSSTSQDNHLNGVSCVSTTVCQAVGQYLGSPQWQTLAESWNGTAWTVVSSPNVSASDYENFDHISCTNSSFCMATGYYNTGSWYQTLAATWNGTAWTQVTSPNSSTTQNNILHGVSCPSAPLCTTGGYYQGSAAQTMVQQWNGSALSIMTSANSLSTQTNVLHGVACPTTTLCFSDGYYANAGGSDQTLIEEWQAGSTSLTITAPGAVSLGSGIAPGSKVNNAALGALNWANTLSDGQSWSVTLAATDLYNSGNGDLVPFTKLSVGVGQSFTLGGSNTGGNPTAGTAGPTALAGSDPSPGSSYSGALTLATGTATQQGTYTQSGNTVTVSIPANLANSGTMTGTVQYTITG